ncbi:MAG: hypothetical protein HKL89_01280 [Candidatus Dormibacteraeota bacterium]|nr:hypothetical protein [Candidatus Dormibacteraeota bacterium]
MARAISFRRAALAGTLGGGSAGGRRRVDFDLAAVPVRWSATDDARPFASAEGRCSLQ